MIDIKFLRENPDAVRENIKKKFQDSKLPLVDEVMALDVEKRATQQKADGLRASRNKLSKPSRSRRRSRRSPTSCSRRRPRRRSSTSASSKS